MLGRAKTRSGNRGKLMKDNNINKRSARQIVVEFLKKRKNTERVEVATIEQSREAWVIRGTCPIDLEGHPWAERFEIVLDTRGKIKSTNFALL
jgi:hypothetical protein